MKSPHSSILLPALYAIALVGAVAAGYYGIDYLETRDRAKGTPRLADAVVVPFPALGLAPADAAPPLNVTTEGTLREVREGRAAASRSGRIPYATPGPRVALMRGEVFRGPGRLLGAGDLLPAPLPPCPEGTARVYGVHGQSRCSALTFHTTTDVRVEPARPVLSIGQFTSPRTPCAAHERTDHQAVVFHSANGDTYTMCMEEFIEKTARLLEQQGATVKFTPKQKEQR